MTNELTPPTEDELELIREESPHVYDAEEAARREAEFAEAIQSLSDLRHAFDSRQSVQKIRIGFSNRISAMTRATDENIRPIPRVYTLVYETLAELESNIEKVLAEEIKKNEVYNQWLSSVKGIGPSLAGQMVAMLRPPLPGVGPSTWYKAAGLTPELRPDGEYRLPRPRKGEGKITYYKPLRVCLYNVATSLIRTNGYYRKVYESERLRLDTLHAGDEKWPKSRCFSAARWSMIRLFLAHLWEAWCEIEHIDNARKAYVIEHLGHHYIPRPMPEEYGGKI